jgi:hypothetical protein
MSSFFDVVKSAFQTIVGAIRDPILYHVDINTEYGRGNFIIQVRKNEKTQETYLLLSLKGADERIHYRIREQYYSEFFGKIDDVKNEINFKEVLAYDNDGTRK